RQRRLRERSGAHACVVSKSSGTLRNRALFLTGRACNTRLSECQLRCTDVKGRLVAGRGRRLPRASCLLSETKFPSEALESWIGADPRELRVGQIHAGAGILCLRHLLQRL